MSVGAYILAIAMATGSPDLSRDPQILAEEASSDAALLDSRVRAELIEHWVAITNAFRAGNYVQVGASAREMRELLDQAIIMSGGARREQSLLRAMRGLVEAWLGDADRTTRAFDLIDTRERDDASVVSLQYLSGAILTDMALIVDALERDVAQRGMSEGSLIGTLTEDQVLSLLQLLADDEYDALRTRFARLLIAVDWNADAAPGDRDWMFQTVADAEIEDGNLEAATAALARVQMPGTLMKYLYLEEYAALRPLLDAEHGDDLSLAVRRYGETLQTALDARPDDPRILTMFGLHLRETGEPERALAVMAGQADDIGWVREQGEHGFWLVNEAAYAELDLGMGEEAISRMDRLVSLGLASNPSLVSMAINRLAVMEAAGDPARTLAEAESLAAQLQNYASPYGHMWVWSIAACVAYRTGDPERAEFWLSRVEELREENLSALMRSQLCMNDLDAAEALAIERLEGDSPETMLSAFQETSVEVRLTPYNETMLERLLAVRDRPAVRAAIEEVGSIRRFAVSTGYWGNF